MIQNPNELALELVNHCLRGISWPDDLLGALIDSALSADPKVAEQGSHALFGIVVERLADMFEPALCDVYARLFSEVIDRAVGLPATELVDRYQRIRLTRSFEGPDPARISVLSRVTLGADVAITSVILDAMKRRFPKSEICFVGPAKNWDLFAGDARLTHVPVSYGRGSRLGDKLEIWPELQAQLNFEDSIVIDPDSRLTQLGLLPVCAEHSYYFFESRAFGGYENDSLQSLTMQWLEQTFNVSGGRAFIAPSPCEPIAPETITVSLGVGENQAKRVPDPFERGLLKVLAATGRPVLIDSGTGGEEARRVERAGRGAQIDYLEGSFARFASAISCSGLYVGYDSAGQHVAAACGVPLITIFAGFISDRMLARWKPTGPGPKELIVVRSPDPDLVLEETEKALGRLCS